MNLFAGLEKFGFQPAENVDLYEDEKADKKGENGGADEKSQDIPKEEDFLLVKTIRCTVCDKPFKTKVVKSGRVKRVEPDVDLRPRNMYIDTLKYDTASCPYCGYTAMNRYFEHLTSGQIKMIKESICSNYHASAIEERTSYDYDYAIDMHKLSLFNTIAKKGKTSEKAYSCLIISWLLRAKAEQLEKEQPEKKEEIEKCRKDEQAFYVQAFDGFTKAVSTELFPMCGMDQGTVDYLLAAMAFKMKKYELASKSLANVLTSINTGRKMKDKALELKEQIIKELRKKK